MALRLHPGPGCSGSLLSGRMTDTVIEAGRGGTGSRSRDPGRQQKSTNACPSPCLPPTASPRAGRPHSAFPQGLDVAHSLPTPLSWLLCGLGGQPARTASMSNLASLPLPLLTFSQWGAPAVNGREENEGGCLSDCLRPPPPAGPRAGCVLKVQLLSGDPLSSPPFLSLNAPFLALSGPGLETASL